MPDSTPKYSWLGIYIISTCTIALFLTGCESVPVWEQTALAHPRNQFSESPTHQYEIPSLANVEPGTDSRGGASASGCSACQ